VIKDDDPSSTSTFSSSSSASSKTAQSAPLRPCVAVAAAEKGGSDAGAISACRRARGEVALLCGAQAIAMVGSGGNVRREHYTTNFTFCLELSWPSLSSQQIDLLLSRQLCSFGRRLAVHFAAQYAKRVNHRDACHNQSKQHATRHTPHATRHTPHATRHTPHATRHTSHVTRHTSLSHANNLAPDISLHAQHGLKRCEAEQLRTMAEAALPSVRTRQACCKEEDQ
jgi:hypothetical protein